MTIDDDTFPYKVLSIRGRAAVEVHDHYSDQYARVAERYLGAEGATAWLNIVKDKKMARIVITPNWVGLLDFETRVPSVLH